MNEPLANAVIAVGAIAALAGVLLVRQPDAAAWSLPLLLLGVIVAIIGVVLLRAARRRRSRH